ncbi:MAG: alpha/beta hydrolase, partial [Corynebacterium humireducens]|nr:alpha/beta hydrolase [Corynebacterium humireducens]
VASLPAVSGAELGVRPLLIQATGDPQTPYGTHRALADAMNAHVVTVNGSGHGHVGLGNAAVDEIVVDYLRDGQVTVTEVPGLNR